MFSARVCAVLEDNRFFFNSLVKLWCFSVLKKHALQAAVYRKQHVFFLPFCRKPLGDDRRPYVFCYFSIFYFIVFLYPTSFCKTSLSFFKCFLGVKLAIVLRIAFRCIAKQALPFFRRFFVLVRTLFFQKTQFIGFHIVYFTLVVIGASGIACFLFIRSLVWMAPLLSVYRFIRLLTVIALGCVLSSRLLSSGRNRVWFFSVIFCLLW